MTTAQESETNNAGLQAASDRFIVWLRENREPFLFQHAAHPLRQLTLLKPFCEFVLCNELLLSYGCNRKVLYENLLWAWDELEQGNYLLRLLLARPDAFQIASLYAPLHRQGFRNQRLDVALRHIDKMRGTAVAEIQPWMQLGYRHALAQIASSPYNPLSVPNTWLLAKPEPWCVNDQILYAITHEVLYAADFGRCVCRLPEEICHYLELWLPVWAQIYIEEGNWDLTGELIMVADCLGGGVWEDDPLPQLLAQQDMDGIVRGPPGAGALLRDGTECGMESAFFGYYHTTLVAAMAVGLRQFHLAAQTRSY